MAETNNWNSNVIQEFRTNGGKVGGPFEGAHLLLLHTIGAKSGKEYTTPLVYLPDGERFIIFASKAGAPTNPDWYHNLLAHPNTTIEVGSETLPITAVVASEAERDQLYARQVAISPQFGEYEKKTERKIPAVILTRR